MPKKKLKIKSVNYKILIEMLGDLKAPYDNHDTLSQLEKLISIIAREALIRESKKIKLIKTILKEMNHKASRLIKLVDYDTATLTLNKCYDLSIELEFYDLVTLTFNNYALYYKRINNLVKAYECINKAHDMAVEAQEYEYIGEIYLNKTAILVGLSDFKNAYKIGRKAVVYLHKRLRTLSKERASNEDIETVAKDLVISNFNLGFILTKFGQFEEAEDIYEKAIRLYHCENMEYPRILEKIEEALEQLKKNICLQKAGNLNFRSKTYEVFGAKRKKGDHMLNKEDLHYLEEKEDDEITTIKNFMIKRATDEKQRKEEEDLLFSVNAKRSKLEKTSMMTSELEETYNKYSHHDYTKHRRSDIMVEIGGINDDVFDEFDGIMMTNNERDAIYHSIENKVHKDESEGSKEENEIEGEINKEGFEAFVKNIKNFQINS